MATFSASHAKPGVRELPPGFTLRALRFTAGEGEPAFWVSSNLYDQPLRVEYPRPEMAAIWKVRSSVTRRETARRVLAGHLTVMAALVFFAVLLPQRFVALLDRPGPYLPAK